jgi:hypothetical protein
VIGGKWQGVNQEAQLCDLAKSLVALHLDAGQSVYDATNLFPDVRELPIDQVLVLHDVLLEVKS